MLGRRQCRQLLIVPIPGHITRRFILGDVGYIDDGLERQKGRIAERSQFVLGQISRTGRLAGRQRRIHLLKGRDRYCQRLIAVAQKFLQGGEALFHKFQISEDQLHVDGIHVAHGIDRAVHMDDVAVIKTADYVQNGIYFADMGQELVAESLPV